jgi:hypothetical protein
VRSEKPWGLKICKAFLPGKNPIIFYKELIVTISPNNRRLAQNKDITSIYQSPEKIKCFASPVSLL